MLHNVSSWSAGFGLENGVVYQSGDRHRFYTGTTQTAYGFLSAEINRDNLRFYGSYDAGSDGVISNVSAGTRAESYFSLANNTGNGIIFLNLSAKTSDGGANIFTLRNDVTGGDLRLSAKSDSPFIYLKNLTGRVGIGHNNPSSRFTIEATHDDADSGLCRLDAGDDCGNDEYNFKIYPYVVGGGQVGYKFRVSNNYGAAIDPISIRHDGITFSNYNTYFMEQLIVLLILGILLLMVINDLFR